MTLISLRGLYLKGGVAVLAKTAMGEEPIITLKDLYHQRVRWYRANVENLSKYFIPMVKAPIPFSRKTSWLSFLMVQFLAFLSSPLFITYFGKIKKLSNGPLEFVIISLGVVGYAWLMTVCGIVASVKHLTSSTFEWKPSTRSNV